MTTKRRLTGLLLTSSLLSVPMLGYAGKQVLNDSAWTTQGLRAIAAAEKLPQNQRERARNVILFVGDGMGVSTLTAARILEGQKKGQPGEENKLSFEEFPYLSLVKTYSVNQQTSDSAPTMTAMVTGVKTDDGVLSYDEDVINGDQATAAGNELKTILELAEEEGLATGVVSTARITHATPAACYAHSVNREEDLMRKSLGVEPLSTRRPGRVPRFVNSLWRGKQPSRPRQRAAAVSTNWLLKRSPGSP